MASLIALVTLLAGCQRPGGAADRGAAAGADTSAASRTRQADAATASAPACSGVTEVGALPRLLSESSGLAASRRHPGVLWTHNDSGGEPALYALDTTGRLLATVRVAGARNLDWEDIALGPCSVGDCLYIGDIGDNNASRAFVDVYVVPEPPPRDGDVAPSEHLVLQYPDGPRDAEALYVMPDTSIYIVSKGRGAPAALYVASAEAARTAAPGTTLRLRRIQVLSVPKPTVDGLVTAADASPDGRWVAVRTYAWLQLYRPRPDGTLAPALPGPGIGLEDAGETQGEAVAFGAGDTIWLSSEAGPLPGGEASLGRVLCRRP